MSQDDSQRQNLIAVLVVDRTRVDAQLTASVFGRDPRVKVTRAIASAEEALTAISVEQFDVAIISATLEGSSHAGFELTRTLREAGTQIRVVILLDVAKTELIVEAFRAGAKGVFCRSDSPSDLRKCAFVVHNGEIAATPEQLTKALEALADLPQLRLTDVKGNVLLSKRETDIVCCVAEGLSNREISARLKISEHTVKNYMFRIFDKLGVSSRVEVVLYAANQRNSVTPTGSVGRRNGHRRDVAWYQELAESGFGVAHLVLGELYCRGDNGVSKNSIDAYIHFVVAERICENGRDTSRSCKENLANKLSAAQMAEAQERASEWLKAHACTSELAKDELEQGSGLRFDAPQFRQA